MHTSLHMYCIISPGDTLSLCTIVLLCDSDCMAAVCVLCILLCKHMCMFMLLCVLVFLCLLDCKFQTCSLNNSGFYVLLPWLSAKLLLGPVRHTHTHTLIWACWQMWTPPCTLQRRQTLWIRSASLYLPLHFTLLLLLKLLLLTSLARVWGSLLF